MGLDRAAHSELERYVLLNFVQYCNFSFSLHVSTASGFQRLESRKDEDKFAQQ